MILAAQCVKMKSKVSLAGQWLTENVRACCVRYEPVIKARATHKNSPDLLPILLEMAKEITSLTVEGMQRAARESNAKK